MPIFGKKEEKRRQLAESFKCLRPQDIHVGCTAQDRFEAIRMAGQYLVARGSVEPDYIEAMIARENTVTTYIGEGVAIPHGVGEAKKLIKETGLVVLQFPQGVAFGDEKAQLVIGIAGLDDEHLPILRAVANIMLDETLLEQIKTTPDADYIYRTLAAGEPET